MKNKLKILFLIIAIIFTIFIYGYVCYSYYEYPLKYKTSIQKYSNEYNVESELVASVINCESGFNKDAVSKKGAVGLMQLMPQTAFWLCDKLNIEYDKDYLFDADFNIKLGTYYLSYLKTRFDGITEILCAYNAGEGVVKNWLKNELYSNDGKNLKVIPYHETNLYVQKVQKNVLSYHKKLRNN